MDAVWIALIVIIMLIVLVIIGWPLLLRRFLQRYYFESYMPEDLSQEQVLDFPAEHHLQNVPWIAYSLQVCQSTSLQMIASQHGVDYPRSYHDFLMGFTYGASRLPKVGFSPFGSDPEIGLIVAAPYLGLARRYFITQDPALFCSAMRSFLAQGQAVRLALDMGSLYGQPDFLPHSEVLVGYDPKGFNYYETVARPPADVQPGHRPPGERGLYMSDETCLRAVERLSGELKYPWRYALTVFDLAETEQDLRPVWTRNGNMLIEDSKYGPKMGARVIDELADEVVREGHKFKLDTIRAGITLAAELRQENADFLRQVFPHDTDLLAAAEQMELAAKDYRQIMEEIEDGIASQIEAKRIATRLREAAGAERKTGEIFRKRGLPDEEKP